MIRGCFTNLFASIGCLAVLCFGAAGAWYFRADISDAYSSVVERDTDGGDVQFENVNFKTLGAATQSPTDNALTTEITRNDNKILFMTCPPYLC